MSFSLDGKKCGGVCILWMLLVLFVCKVRKKISMSWTCVLILYLTIGLGIIILYSIKKKKRHFQRRASSMNVTGYLLTSLHQWGVWNLVCRLDVSLVDLCMKFIKIKWVMTSLWHHLSFPETNVHISNSNEITNFIFGTNIQQNKMIKRLKCKWPRQTLKVTGEGQRSNKINKCHIL